MNLDDGTARLLREPSSSSNSESSLRVQKLYPIRKDTGAHFLIIKNGRLLWARPGVSGPLYFATTRHARYIDNRLPQTLPDISDSETQHEIGTMISVDRPGHGYHYSKRHNSQPLKSYISKVKPLIYSGSTNSLSGGASPLLSYIWVESNSPDKEEQLDYYSKKNKKSGRSVDRFRGKYKNPGKNSATISMADKNLVQFLENPLRSKKRTQTSNEKSSYSHKFGKNIQRKLHTYVLNGSSPESPSISSHIHGSRVNEYTSPLFEIYEQPSYKVPSKVTFLQNILHLLGLKRKPHNKHNSGGYKRAYTKRRNLNLGVMEHTVKRVELANHYQIKPYVGQRISNQNTKSEIEQKTVKSSSDKRSTYYKCSYRQITFQMLREYLDTGKLCGSYILPFRFGIGK